MVEIIDLAPEGVIDISRVVGVAERVALTDLLCGDRDAENDTAQSTHFQRQANPVPPFPRIEPHMNSVPAVKNQSHRPQNQTGYKAARKHKGQRTGVIERIALGHIGNAPDQRSGL